MLFRGKPGAYLLNGHHDLDGVETVQTKVIREVGSAVNLYVKRVN